MTNAEQQAAHYLSEAMSAHQRGELAAAEELYARTLQLTPNHARALRLKGTLARERGETETSLDLLRRAADLAPDDPQPVNELALTYMMEGDLSFAAETLHRALELAPDSFQALSNLGAIMQQRGHVRQAIAIYQHALTLHDDDAQLRCNLAKALSDAGETEAALAECDYLANLPDAAPLALSTRAAVLLDTERYTEVLDCLAEAVAPEIDDMTLINRALAARHLNQLTAATADLEQALRVNPHNARAVADLADCRSRAGDHARAVQLCADFLASYPGERLVLGAYALALHNSGDAAAALALTDGATLIRVFDIDAAQGFANMRIVNDLLSDELRNDPSLLANPVSKATFGGDQTGELDPRRSLALQALVNEIKQRVHITADDFVAAGLANHPVMAPARAQQSLRIWGTLLRAGGGQSSHMHPLGWLSGVYYPHLPADMSVGDPQAGWLEFNRPPERFHCVTPTRTWQIEPREGRLVIFPSWFWHRTLPFASADERISIAFDVVPTAALRMV